MYEHYQNEFEYLTTDTPFCAIQLLKEPFKGVKLYIGREFTFSDIGTDEQTVRFDYDIFDKPEGFTEEHVTQEFDELLMGIFLSILEKKMTQEAVIEELKGGINTDIK